MPLREIARRLGTQIPRVARTERLLDRNTVGRIIRKMQGARRRRVMLLGVPKLALFEPRIKELAASGRTAWSLFDELRADLLISGL